MRIENFPWGPWGVHRLHQCASSKALATSFQCSRMRERKQCQDRTYMLAPNTDQAIMSPSRPSYPINTVTCMFLQNSYQIRGRLVFTCIGVGVQKSFPPLMRGVTNPFLGYVLKDDYWKLLCSIFSSHMRFWFLLSPFYSCLDITHSIIMCMKLKVLLYIYKLLRHAYKFACTWMCIHEFM